jgi:O6-methylguanine-DNA--protein-cysteine methyltransferase
LEQAVKQLNEYFEGSRKNFELPLEPEGTEFQKVEKSSKTISEHVESLERIGQYSLWKNTFLWRTSRKDWESKSM